MMNIKEKRNRTTFRGITLVETMLYITIFGLIFLSIMYFFFSISDSNTKGEAIININKSEIFLNQHLNNTFSDTISIDTLASVFGDDQSSVTLNTTSGVVVYKILDNSIYYEVNSQDYLLTNPSIKVDSFYLDQVEKIDGSVIGVKVRIIMSTHIEPDTSKTMRASYLIL